jgi:hypothetical protein
MSGSARLIRYNSNIALRFYDLAPLPVLRHYIFFLFFLVFVTDAQVKLEVNLSEKFDSFVHMRLCREQYKKTPKAYKY